MRLILNKGQKPGMLTGKITFELEARAELTPEEAAALKKYRFGKEVVYSKENVTPTYARRNTWDGIGRNFAAAFLNLTITADDLVKGKKIECKSILEMLQAEETIDTACTTLKAMLEAALSFGGETAKEY